MNYSILLFFSLCDNFHFSSVPLLVSGMIEHSTVVIMVSALIVLSLLLVVYCAALLKKLRNLSVEHNKQGEEKNKVIEKAKTELSNQNDEIQKLSEQLVFMTRELNHFTIVAQESDNAIVIFSAAGKPEWVNAGFTRWNGYTLQEFIAAKGDNFFEMESVKEIQPLLKHCRENKKSISYQAHISTKDDKKMWIQTTLTPILSDSGEISKFIAIDTNIDKLKLAEEELQQQREEIKTQAEQLEDVNSALEYLSLVARKTDNAVVIADKNGNIEWINEGFKKLYGYASLEEFKQIVGENLFKISRHLDIRSAIKTCIKKNESLIYESLLPTKTGADIWIQSTLTPIFDDAGNLLRLVEIDTDINKIKIAEEEIRQQNEEIQSQAELLFTINKELEKLSIIASETDNSIVISDEHGTIEWVNEGFTKLFGYTLNEFIKEKGGTIISASHNPHISDFFNHCVEKKESVMYTSLNSTKAGKSIWVQTTLTPILDESRYISKLIAIDSDITKLKQAEEEIKQQKEELIVQSELLSKANRELEQKNLFITDSINYAKLIQEAILPPQRLFKQHFPESFILFKPRDIVSGDFYWFQPAGDKLYIAVADCTGHGVSGAFMAMIGVTLLNEIFKNQEVSDLSIVLENLDAEISSILNQKEQGAGSQDDGMDISLCCINKKTNEIQVSLAHQSLMLVSDNQLQTIEGDLISIGGAFKRKKNNRFTSRIIKPGKDSVLYIYSDGYFDQVGGEKKKKFMMTPFEKLAMQNSGLPMEEQFNVFNSTFNDWKGNYKQIDDVTVIGIKI